MAGSKAKRRSEMTAEELKAVREYHRQYQKRYRLGLLALYENKPKRTKKERNAYQLSLYHKRKTTMTDEEREAKRIRQREYMRQRRAKMYAEMSDEERKEYFKYEYEERRARELQKKLNNMGIAQKET